MCEVPAMVVVIEGGVPVKSVVLLGRGGFKMGGFGESVYFLLGLSSWNLGC